MKKILMLTTAITLLSCSIPSLSLAQTCSAAPSCADMGYNKTATECAGKDYLRCPFDTSAYFCGEVCDFSNFPLQTCPTNGVCSNYTCSGMTKYKLDSCSGCYTVSGNSCVERECCGFNYTDENLHKGEQACYNINVINGYSYNCFIDECYSNITKQFLYRIRPIVYCFALDEHVALETIVDTYTCPEY